VGIANYAELAKGQMLGGMDGFLKIIFSTDDFRILGVHAIGEGATEIVHIGQVRVCVRACGDGACVRVRLRLRA
jgi:NAD(P) transhydrogenase